MAHKFLSKEMQTSGRISTPVMDPRQSLLTLFRGDDPSVNPAAQRSPSVNINPKHSLGKTKTERDRPRYCKKLRKDTPRAEKFVF